MFPTRRLPYAQGIKCPTIHSGHIPATSQRVWWLRRMASTFTSTGLFSVGIHQTASICNPFNNSRNFEAVLRTLVPACHLPCCTLCNGKCSPVSRCVFLLKDTILSMTNR
ncbi:hypothetical protein AVEN_157194-1 [Araneus ventricosus]|uniref:Uncharacterized protein n=1 Tax=Araneus ventricosus TaxID=182803 RepID=A0A4Y2EED7_ARAVE|nr:hypothetical protein AVEN_157194-1 [Araneus ventricosus]